MPGRPGGGRLWLYAVGAVVLVWIGVTSVHSIGAKERGVVTFLGSYSRTLNPGMNYTLPWPLESVQIIEVEEIRTIDLGSAGDEPEKLVLTGDQNIINLAIRCAGTSRIPSNMPSSSPSPTRPLARSPNRRCAA